MKWNHSFLTEPRSEVYPRKAEHKNLFPPAMDD